MKKQIVIIGSGISGLTLLHYLNIKYYFNQDVEISLLEKNAYPGGTIRSTRESGFLFETGPNGFLNSSERTLKLISEAGLNNSLIPADENAQKRYISYNNKLHRLPTNPKDFISFPLFNTLEKIRTFSEIFIPKGKSNDNESIYEFGERRFGKKAAELFFDPMVSGIYAGNAKEISLKQAYPKIHKLEQSSRSLILGMIKSQRKNKTKHQLTSLREGMGELTEALASKYHDQITLNCDVTDIKSENNKFSIQTINDTLEADVVYLCTNAPSASFLTHSLDAELSDTLKQITYAPVAVVGLGYKNEDIPEIPSGFGYLVPSNQKSEVLGVLFESQIFHRRSPENHSLFRLMLGGAHHPDVASKTKDEIIQQSIDELNSILKIDGKPKYMFVHQWKKAIPQYTYQHSQIAKQIDSKLSKWTNFNLIANYRGGVALNDCIENAYQAAKNCSL